MSGKHMGTIASNTTSWFEHAVDGDSSGVHLQGAHLFHARGEIVEWVLLKGLMQSNQRFLPLA